MCLVGSISILAIISPRAGKIEEVFELINDPLIKGVKSLEPNCLSFHANRERHEENEEPDIFMIERFRDFAAIEFHQNNPAFSAFARALEEKDLLRKPLYIKIVQPVLGFDRN